MTKTHELHRKRRKPLEPFFSRHGIERFEPLIAEEVNKMDRRLQSLKLSNRVVRLDHVFSAFTGDVIGNICCESPPNFIDDPDFAPHWYYEALKSRRTLLKLAKAQSDWQTCLTDPTFYARTIFAKVRP